LRRNCLVKHLIEGNKEVIRRGERRGKQLLDDNLKLLHPLCVRHNKMVQEVQSIHN